jgi:hypothetical protein
MISRDGKIMHLKAAMGEIQKVNFTYKLDSENNKKNLSDFWLRDI